MEGLTLFFLRPSAPLDIPIDFIHFCKFFGRTGIPSLTPQEIPIPSVFVGGGGGRGSGVGIFTKTVQYEKQFYS